MEDRVHVRRTRKYRTDILVHVAFIRNDKYPNRSMKILCTNHWVFAHQLKTIDEPVSCIRCIAALGGTR